MNSSSGSGVGALGLHPGVEVGPHRAVRAVELGAVGVPLTAVGAAAGPENGGGTSGPVTSSGLHDTIRTNGAPEVTSAGKSTTLSSTMTSGRCLATISRSRGSQYFAPSMSA